MVDELTPDGVRSRRFDVARRGYDRGQVEAFLDVVAARLDDLEHTVAQWDAGGLAVGIDDREALARELHTIGGDVAAILEAARAAAEGMRMRAEADVEVWTTDAQRRSDEMITAAEDQSQAARSAAWKEGTALLASATAEVTGMIDAAKEETLFVRAEAEREALRLTGDARRDRDEIVRAARIEAESLLERSRVDSESVLRAANQQADQAQERARALEDRRAELLAELEAARASISEVEDEIESKRQELEAPPPEAEPEDDRSHHGEDGGSVRIVSPSAVVPLRPVDAEELVAEVTALRSAPPTPGATVDTEPEPRASGGEDPAVPPPAMRVVGAEHTADEASAPEASDQEAAEPEAATEPDADDVIDEAPTEPAVPSDAAETVELPVTPAELVDAVAPGTEESATEEPSAVETAIEEPAEEEPVADEPATDDIGSLFAALRSTPDPEGGSEASASADGHGDSASPSPSAPAPVDAGGADDTAPATTSPPSEPILESQSASESAAPDEAVAIPVQNEALRSIKRTLVELQNETLEQLRTDETWLPTEEFVDRFRPDFAQLSASLTGTADDRAGVAFGADLYDAVSSAIERSREAGIGDREVAAAASKIFRMWRSDEAERRVIEAAAAPV